MKHEDLVLSNELITEGITLQTSVFQISTFINSCDKTKFSRFNFDSYSTQLFV